MKVRTLVGKSLVVLFVLVLSAGMVSAAGFTYNFDDGSNPFTTVAGGPTVTTDQAHSASNSLYIAPGDDALLAIPGAASGGRVTMWIFDRGNWCDGNAANGGSYANGWRAGLTGSVTEDSAHIALVQRSYFGSDGGYAYGQGGGDGGTFGGWYSPWWSSTSRQVTSLSATANDGSSGVGAWAEWSFTFTPDGNVAINLCDGSGNSIPSGMNSVIPGGATGIFLYGGDSQLGGLYVDDVTFTPAPEPMTMALLGAGAVLGLVRRNRRK
jgi:hypothetical protein